MRYVPSQVLGTTFIAKFYLSPKPRQDMYMVQYVATYFIPIRIYIGFSVFFGLLGLLETSISLSSPLVLQPLSLSLALQAE